MFSFRTTPLEEQLDRALRDGKVGCFCNASAWNPASGEYVWEIFEKRGNLARVFRPSESEKEPYGKIDFSQEDLEDLNAVVVDFQDSGCRHYAFTRDLMRLLLFRSRMEEGPSIYIIDRPNPMGREVEGTLPTTLEAELWTAEVTHRHGLTIGELAYYYQHESGENFPLHVISADTFPRELMSWAVPPASDIPGLFTLAFYTGGSLWHDTSISPGTGTSRPYEYIGAPFIKPSSTPPCPEGVLMRPCHFTPAFGPYEGQECGGYQILLRPGARYHSLMHTLRLMRFFSEHYSGFEMSESLFVKIANPVIAEYLRGGITFDIVQEHIKSEEQKWTRKARRFCLYGDSPCRIK